MATPLGPSFSTDEKAVAQADLKLLGSTIESLVVEFDQEKYDQFLSSGSIIHKAMRQYCKVSTETGSQVSSETSLRRTSLKVNRALVTKANSLNTLETLTISSEDNIVCANISQETPAITRGQ